MGAWSEELDGNDTAKDAIGCIGDMLGVPSYKAHALRDWGTLPEYRMKPQQVRIALLVGEACDRYGRNHWGLLGAASWLLAHNYGKHIKVSNLAEIQMAINDELRPSQIQSWRAPAERRAVLAAFSGDIKMLYEKAVEKDRDRQRKRDEADRKNRKGLV